MKLSKILLSLTTLQALIASRAYAIDAKDIADTVTGNINAIVVLGELGAGAFGLFKVMSGLSKLSKPKDGRPGDTPGNGWKEIGIGGALAAAAVVVEAATGSILG